MQVSTSTVSQIAEQFLGANLTPADVEASANMLNALAGDMQAARGMNVEEVEPAGDFEVRGPQP